MWGTCSWGWPLDGLLEEARAVADARGWALAVDAQASADLAGVTLTGPMEPETAWVAVQFALEAAGYGLVVSEGVASLRPIGPAAAVSTRTFRLEWVSAEDVARVFGELFPRPARFAWVGSSNTLLASGSGAVLERVDAMLRHAPEPGEAEVEVIPLVHVAAEDVVGIGCVDGRVVADPPTNSLIVVGSAECRAAVRAAAAQVDLPSGSRR